MSMDEIIINVNEDEYHQIRKALEARRAKLDSDYEKAIDAGEPFGAIERDIHAMHEAIHTVIRAGIRAVTKPAQESSE